MNEDGHPTRTVRRFAYLIGLVGFLFPFLAVSCMGEEVASPTGFQLAFGAEVSVNEELNERDRAEITEALAEDNPTAPVLLLAIASLAVATGIAFSKNADTAPKGLTISLPILVLVILAIFWSNVGSETEALRAFGLGFDYAPGAGLLVTAAAALAGGIAEMTRPGVRAPESVAPARPPPTSASSKLPVSRQSSSSGLPSGDRPGSSAAAFCVKCGKPFRPPDRYCGGCGHPRNQ